jgi:hypothetical protein
VKPNLRDPIPRQQEKDFFSRKEIPSLEWWLERDFVSWRRSGKGMRVTLVGK